MHKMKEYVLITNLRMCVLSDEMIDTLKQKITH